MLEPDERLPEPLEDPAVFNLLAVEMFLPELDRAFWRRVGGGGNLAGALPARHSLVRKRGQDRADLGVRVGVVQMIVSVPAVKQHRLLNQPLTQNLRAEVDIFLGAGCTQSDVMKAFNNRVCHTTLPSRMLPESG